MPLSLLFVLLILAYAVRHALVDGRDRRLPPPADPEVARLRDEVDVLSTEVRRLNEAHTFMLRLLAEGGTPSALPHGAADAPPPNDRPNPEMPDGDA